jgi:hypothetical protein
MSKVIIPMGLPQSLLIDALVEKSNIRKDVKFNLVSMLDDFRGRVSKEVRFISELFPEYTPHDEEFHLNRLFHLADKLLGDSILSNLNSTELFILCASLYGHDWGMAVSETERELIQSNNIQEIYDRDDFAPIENEHNRLCAHLKESGTKENSIPTLTQWQEYIRVTHAERSGERARSFFKKIDSGLGEAIARVCEAHWLDFKNLQDTIGYPTNYAILNETVNLKALSVYLRLIDLLDITQERTPYIIWKYVAPKDLRSKMEWEKHKAIFSISFPSYQDGRIVQVDGSTNNHEVYASLIDLRNFCDHQLKGCNDILTNINDSRYNLNIFHIDWRIQPRGFSAISIQFEFDRLKMFQILSDEIYQGDKYVFLRELLQNSIDAINTRKGILEKKGFYGNNQIGLIEINVTHNQNGDCEILFSDDGIGMDEYVIKNYLSVAGKSFYNSDDFKKLGINMDPISKFGVGVLSCFMVADRVDIETFKDPYAQSKSGTIKIQIHSVNQQFRIQTFTDPESKVGTTFKVFVKGEKLKSKTRENPVNKIRVTEYLKRIAGFVRIPIKITEDDQKTLIIHPFENSTHFSDRHPGYKISTINTSYPWDDVFLPQSLKSAKEILKDNIIKVPQDLSCDGLFEGIISLLEPIDENATLTNVGESWPGSDFVIKTPDGSINKRIKFNSLWSRYNTFRAETYENEFGKSAKLSRQFRFYLDGILVPNTKPPKNLFSSPFESDLIHEQFNNISFSADRFCVPYIVLNFKKNALSAIDLSRTEIIGNENQWENITNKYLYDFIQKKYLEKLPMMDNMSRLFQISRLIIFHHIRPSVIKKYIDIRKWPVPIITNEGNLEIKVWEDLVNKNIYKEPERFEHFYKAILQKIDIHKKYPKDKLDNWQGGDFILNNNSNEFEGKSSHLILMMELHNLVISETHKLSSYRFLGSPWKGAPPLIQSVWAPIISNEVNQYINPSDLLKKGSKDATLLQFDEFLAITEYFYRTDTEDRNNIRFPEIGEFNSPYQDKLSYSFNILNFNHPNTKNIIGILCSIILARIENTAKPAVINELLDKINELPFLDYSAEYEGVTIEEINEVLEDIAKLASEESVHHRFIPEPVSIESFVENSIYKDENKYFGFNFDKIKLDSEFNEDYSQPL